MMHLRQPIVPPKDRPLSVLIHARFSTEEQRQSSIDDQVAACRALLDSGLPQRKRDLLFRVLFSAHRTTHPFW